MKSIYQALLAAQSEMRGAHKSATNPHFRSQYADLESVQKACFPQLHKHGIAVVQLPGQDENGHYLETMFVHGESGESISNRCPVMMTKQDAQGYGSGLTYARRYGLMSLAGLAPTDDDGNAACEPVEADPPKAAFLEREATKNELIDQAVEIASHLKQFHHQDHFIEWVETYTGGRLKDKNKTKLNAMLLWLNEHQDLADWPEQAVTALRAAERAIGV